MTTLKTQLSKEIRSAFREEIEKQLWDGVFRSRNYFIATTGTTVLENVKQYIKSQRTEEHKRKYEKIENEVIKILKKEKAVIYSHCQGNSSPTDSYREFIWLLPNSLSDGVFLQVYDKKSSFPDY